MNLWLDKDARPHRANPIVEYSEYFVTARLFAHSVVEVFGLVGEECVCSCRIPLVVNFMVRRPILLLVNYFCFLTCHYSFDSRPATNHGSPSDDGVQDHGRWLDYNIFKNNRVYYSRAFTDLCRRSDSDIGADLRIRVYFSSWVDANEALELVRIHRSRLRQNRIINSPVSLHVHFLSFEQL